MIYSRLYYLIAFPVAIAASTQAAAQETADQPLHSPNPITVDGRLHVDEWQAGADLTVTDQGWVRVAQRQEGLYLAARSNMVGMVDVLVLRGDTLYVLHTSAKVGSAVYQRGEDGLWHMTRNFPWIGDKSSEERQAELKARLSQRLKSKDDLTHESLKPPPAPKDDTSDSDAVTTRLEEHGWTASRASMGDPKTSEFFLSEDFLQADDQILVRWPYLSGPKQIETVSFPAEATRMPENDTGMPQTFAMTPENWYAIE